MTPSRAKELIEGAASRAGFAMKATGPIDPDFRDAALNNSAAICQANAAVAARRMKLREAHAAGLLMPGLELAVVTKVERVEAADYDGALPASLNGTGVNGQGFWPSGDIEVILNG